MLPTPSIGQCDPNSLGRATCFVNNWLKYKVIEQYNCSVFYLHHKRPDVQICDPEIIIKNYDTFVDPSLKDYACVPPCLRFDTSIEIYTAMEMAGPAGPIDSGTAAFRIEASYISLEYESYKEILTTTPQGFISELGGQSGLFLGLSIITIIQLLFAISKGIFHKIQNQFIVEEAIYDGH
uniref:Uncharacterized protein n=1 Tax=Panagrolaimus davidi TaxID=227884 RepID=A0A914Q6Z3_9BILA